MRSAMKLRNRGGLGAAVLDVVQRGGANLQAFLVFVVPLRDARVQIPAVVIEACGVGDVADVVEVLALELAESDDDVGDLDAGVVDVVLHLDRHAAKPLHAHERVAERRIPKVADVRRLVRVDGGVLDDGLRSSIVHRRSSIVGRRQLSARERDPIEVDVQVAVRRGVDARDAVDRAERGRELLRDRPWRFAQPPRQLEGNRRRQIAELALRRILDRQLGQRVRRKLIELLKCLQQPFPQAFVNWKNHEG